MSAAFDRRRFLKTVVLTLAVFALIGWGNGYFDVVFSAKAKDLILDLGELRGILTVSVEDERTAYDVVIRHGPDFPRTPADAERRIAAAREPELMRRVIVGGAVRVRLLDSDGEMLESAALDPSLLLGGASNEVAVRISKHRGAKKLRLAVDTAR